MSSETFKKGITLIRKVTNYLKHNRALSSLIVTCLIVALLLIPTPATAIEVTSTFEDAKKLIKDSEDSYTFDVRMKIEGYERVPVNKLRLFINSDYYDFILEGESGPFTVELVETAPYTYGYGYGYGYGYHPSVGYGYGTFTYGYGYGYGYGYAGAPTTYMKWRVTLNPESLTVGSYTFKPEVESNGTWWIGDEKSFNVVNFSVSTSVSVVSIGQGESTTITVTVEVTPSGQSLPDEVSLSVSGLPSGVTATFSPSTISASGGESDLTITTAGDAPVGTYTITVRGTCKQVDRQAQIDLTITGPAAGAAAVAPAPITRPTGGELLENPEEGVEVLEDLVAAGRPEDAAEALEEAAQEDPATAAQILADMDAAAAADVVENMAEEVAAELFEAAVEAGRAEDIGEILEEMDPTEAAEVLDVLAATNPGAAAQILAYVSPSKAATILAELAMLPGTPDKAAAIIEEMAVEDAVEVFEAMVKLKLLRQAALIMAYLSDERLAEVWAGMADKYKEQLLPYMKAETLAKLSILLKAKTANLMLLAAGETATASYLEETGVEVTVTATTTTAGIVKTGLYVVNPYEAASMPEAITLKKFVYIAAYFPEGTISEVTATIHYTDEEAKGLLEFTITVYKYDPDSNAWKPLPTIVDKANNTATITLTEPGTYAIGGI